MKIKTILIGLGCIALLSFTSCEDEMGKGGTETGGMSNEVYGIASIPILRSLEQNIDLGTVSVRVTNTRGEIVLTENLDTSLAISPSINTRELPSGIYYIDISAQDGKTIQRDSFTVK